MGKKPSLASAGLETTAELIIIFTAAASGAVVGSGRPFTVVEIFLAIIFVLSAVILRRIANEG